jgi:hypothetical protein
MPARVPRPNPTALLRALLVVAVVGLLTGADAPRRQPALLSPVEGKGAVVLAQLRSYIFSNNAEQVAVLEGGAPGGAADLKRLASLGRLGPYDFGGRGRANMGSPLSPQNVESARPQARKMFVPLDKLAEQKDVRLAETVRPLRMAVLVASFPYKAQLDEHKAKLNLNSYAEVLAERSAETVKVEGATRDLALPSFRFKGVRLQRRVVDAAGKPAARQPRTIDPEDADGIKELPVEKDGWVTLKPGPAYRPYVVVSGRRIEEDDRKLGPVMFDGLVMPRLLQMRPGRYPPLENDLPLLQEAIKKAARGASGQPRAFNADDFDPFSPRRDERPTRPGPREPERQEIDPVTHCLVRVIDVTVKPGHTYQYRMQVRLANPNYKRDKGLANPQLAREPELTSDRWFVLPDLLAVPELAIYAVDQKVLDGKDEKGRDRYKGLNANVYPDRNAAVLQAHRWLESLPLPGGPARVTVSVGEWSVAERLIVQRGEAIDRYARVEVPIWSDTRESWALMPAAEKNRKGVDVLFGDPARPTVLADSESGEQRHPRVRREQAGGEVLILAPDGRLRAHNTADDSDDRERKARVEAWHKRIEEVRPPDKSIFDR